MEYSKTHPVRPHMPGHKGRPPFDSSYLKNLYAMDITEIEGADSLFESKVIIKKSEDNATSLFKTAGTFYSCGDLIIDTDQKSVSRDGILIELSPKEYSILEYDI